MNAEPVPAASENTKVINWPSVKVAVLPISEASTRILWRNIRSQCSIGELLGSTIVPEKTAETNGATEDKWVLVAADSERRPLS